MELIKKITLGRRFLGGSVDIPDINSCFVWKENAWIVFQAQGWIKGWNLGTKRGLNSYISSQGHWNLFLGMDKEQRLSLPSIAHK